MLSLLTVQLIELSKSVENSKSTEVQGQIYLALLLHFTHYFLRLHVEHPNNGVLANCMYFFAEEIQVLERKLQVINGSLSLGKILRFRLLIVLL